MKTEVLRLVLEMVELQGYLLMSLQSSPLVCLDLCPEALYLSHSVWCQSGTELRKIEVKEKGFKSTLWCGTFPPMLFWIAD